MNGKPKPPRGIPVVFKLELNCGDTPYGVRDEPPEPPPPDDPDFEKRVKDELFRALPVSPIVN